MDVLELLKKDWKKQDKNYPRLSYNELYKLIWKKSSSIVKWIFIISVLELLAGTFINIFLADDDYWQILEKYNLTEITKISYVVSYSITFFFIYRFYRNYRKISATDDAATLMKNILRTRKTVKCYIAYILIYTAVTVVGITTYMIYLHIESQNSYLAKYSFTAWQWFKFLGIFIFILAAFLGLIWLFYRVIYGILLKRLRKNYEELKKLEM